MNPARLMQSSALTSRELWRSEVELTAGRVLGIFAAAEPA
jgi:hypothetical protein